MMASTRSDNEAACLQVAIDLLERSDAYAMIEPGLARQYARQAYELGCRSQWLRHSITRKRIRMIVQKSDQFTRKDWRSAAEISGAVRLSQFGRLRRLRKAGLMSLIFLAVSLLTSTSVREQPPDQRIAHAARIVNAPL